MNQIESNCTIKLLEQVSRLGLEKPRLEFEFDERRKFRADFAFMKKRVLVEIEGWGHRTEQRFELDLHKYNSAASLGWRLVRLTPAMILSGKSIEVLRLTFFPPANYLNRCSICLQPIEENPIHEDCFQSVYERSEIDNEFLSTKAAIAR
jgi:hypothetical protein